MTYDALVIGGGYAGLTAALHVGRAKRSVLVLDARQSRNRFSPHSHGVLAQDGAPGAILLSAARAQVAAYPTVTIRETTVTDVRRVEDHFVAVTKDGESFAGKKLVLATGVVDQLPNVPGLSERWGKSVLHCPYCHGYEVKGTHLAVLGTSTASPHQALSLVDWGEVTYFSNGIAQLDETIRMNFAKRKIRIVESLIKKIDGPGDRVERIVLTDGRTIPADAVYIAAPLKLSPFAEQLGCAFDKGVLGRYVSTDESKMTTVRGVYAIGDHARDRHNINLAAADGTLAGISLHQALMAEELARIAEVRRGLQTALD